MNRIPDYCDNQQKKIIHMLKNQLVKNGELSEDGYRDLMERHYGVRSCVYLTYKQATAFITDLTAMGGVITAKRKTRRPSAPNIIALVSPQELAKIEHLKKDVQWRYPGGYWGLMKKVLRGKDRIITSADAMRVIEALKAIRNRQQAAAPAVEKVGDPF
ncbi:MAG: DUF1018 domain-containing protein [Nitrospirae bacterium]|nr:MAG: DUF1018 domain-containing protein [Nitrospirota bacterium]